MVVVVVVVLWAVGAMLQGFARKPEPDHFCDVARHEFKVLTASGLLLRNLRKTNMTGTT